jgi:hypothetical protein
MNHPDGKRLLAALRDGDFAHAGEEAAVRMNVCRNDQISSVSTLDAAEVERPLLCNPNDGVESSDWTSIRRQFPLPRLPIRA